MLSSIYEKGPFQKFFKIKGFLSAWIHIRIRIQNSNPDPATQRIRIQYGFGSKTLVKCLKSTSFIAIASELFAAERPRVIGAPGGEGDLQAVRAGGADPQPGGTHQARPRGDAPSRPLHRAGLQQDLWEQGMSQLIREI
jgi:hypothetical protein